MTATGEDSPGESRQVLRLRAALRAAGLVPLGDDAARDRAARAVESASAALIDRLYQPLLRYCDGLVSSAPLLRHRVDGVDIAQDCWTKILTYLSGASGDKVTDDLHLIRLLRRAAKTRFLDLLDLYTNGATVLLDVVELDAPLAGGITASATGQAARRGDLIADPRSESFVAGADNVYSERLEMLFTDEKAFRKGCRRPIRRRLIVYKAFVLYELGRYLQNEIETCGPAGSAGTDAETASLPGGSRIALRLMRDYVETIGVPTAWWHAVETAVLSSGTNSIASSEAVLSAVNTVCGVSLTAGNRLSVLRYELNGYISGA